jgi:ABC-type phosphate transport system permease subunit
VIARTLFAMILGALFGGTVAVSALMLSGPLWLMGGYNGAVLALILSVPIGLGVAIYTSRALYKRSQRSSEDRPLSG